MLGWEQAFVKLAALLAMSGGMPADRCMAADPSAGPPAACRQADAGQAAVGMPKGSGVGTAGRRPMSATR
jgi:hypothetical protein